jgi:hypothetical protein
MSNFIYGKAKEALLNGQINVISNSLKLLIIKSDYIPEVNNHQFVSDINSSYIKIRSGTIQNVTNTLGVLDADDVEIFNYSGEAFNAVVIYIDSGNDSTSRLLAYIDTSQGLPFSGVNITSTITIVWNNDFNKIISL